MFKKGHITLLLSLLLHVVILLMINNTRTSAIPKTNMHPPAIKSYIYHKPKKIVITAIQPDKAQPQATKINDVVTPMEPPKRIENKPQVNNPVENQQKSQSTQIPTEEVTAVVDNNVNNEPISSSPTLAPVKKSNFSYNNLQRLREKIQQQTNQQFQRKLTQPNTGSIMHGTPTLVPHSTITPSAEVKKEQATITMSADKSIIKGDDGSCSLVEDLSVVGIEGVTAVSSFSCGETKFNKSFREHMRAVQKKLGKK